MSIATNLASLFRRDLTRLIEQLHKFPSDESIWGIAPGITNSAGTLALHIEGNLREYIGRQLGAIDYIRDRPAEFETRGVPRGELITRMTELREQIPYVVELLSDSQMEEFYPEVVLDVPMQTEEFLLHLYGHLNWHRGQLDYVRRIVNKDSRSVGSAKEDRVG